MGQGLQLILIIWVLTSTIVYFLLYMFFERGWYKIYDDNEMDKKVELIFGKHGASKMVLISLLFPLAIIYTLLKKIYRLLYKQKK